MIANKLISLIFNLKKYKAKQIKTNSVKAQKDPYKWDMQAITYKYLGYGDGTKQQIYTDYKFKTISAMKMKQKEILDTWPKAKFIVNER